MEFKHYSVMLNECLEGLNIHPDGVYVDGTAGGAGHSREIAKRLTTGRLLALDQDPDAVKTASERLREFPGAQVIRANFREVSQVLKSVGISGIDGMLMDLGVSSFQLDNRERGFSYREDAPLDMRMSREGLSARDVINTYEPGALVRILREYGEEKFAKNIVSRIVREREKSPIETTLQLAELIKQAIPAAARREKNPCKRTFQAVRIEVNGELDSLSQGLDQAFRCLNPGGRLVVITFHSLEDRLVKQRFKEWCTGCVCPPELPVCVCGQTPRAKLVYKKPILPSEKELAENSRSKSAKLRILEKIKDQTN